jgi:aminoglycoside 6-adenylyltransferase
MINVLPEPIVLERLTQWANRQESIRAMLLYSSRANPAAPVDAFSDYDILLAVTDIHPFHADDRWLEDFGKVLVVFHNPIGLENCFECFGFITHYQDGTKIDYGFFPVEFLRWAARQPRMPDDLDLGYRVLVDKDGLTGSLPAATHSAFLPQPPTEKEYRAVVEEFFNDALYVAKNLWRDDLFGVKLSLDSIMKFSCLRKMLEWRMNIARNWSIRPGANGKGLKKYIEPALWAELGDTYAGAGTEENWEALFATVRLFRKVAGEVAEPLGYAYPGDMDREVSAALFRVRNLKKDE